MNARVLVVLIGVVLGCQVLAIGGQAQSDVGAQTTAADADLSPSWGSPSLIEAEEAGDALYPRIAMNEAGYGVAVWEQSAKPEGLVHSIWANRYSTSEGWTGPAQVSSTEDLDCTVARAAIDPQGNIIVVWTSFGNGAFNIWSNRYSVGDGWGVAEPIDPSPTISTLLADVVCDSSGNAFAFWLEYGAVKSSRYVYDVGWGPVESVSTHGGYAQPASFGADSQGNAIAIWYDEVDIDGAINRIWCNRYVVGVGWGLDELLMSAWGVGNPSIVVDDAGNAVALWFETKSDASFAPRDIWSCRYTRGTGWSGPELIDSESTGFSWSMKFACDGSGNAIAAWQEYHTETYTFDLWTKSYSPLNGWSPKAEIGADGYSPDIDMNHDGLAVLIWLEYGEVRSSRCTPQTDWTQPELVGTEGSQDLCVAVDGNGDAIAVWMMYYEQSNIYGNEYSSPPEVISATVVIEPGAVSSASMRKWITAYIELPQGYQVSDIVVDSIRLNDQFPATGPGDFVDYDKDKVKELMVKFDWQKIFKTGPVEASQTFTVTITGTVAPGIMFEGSDTITLLAPH